MGGICTRIFALTVSGDFTLFVPAQGAEDGGVDDGDGAREGQAGTYQKCGRGRRLCHVRQVQGHSSGGGWGTGEPNARRRAVQRGKQLKAEQAIFLRDKKTDKV